MKEFLSSKDLKGSFDEPLPEEYDLVLSDISRSGNVKHDWNLLKRVFALKIIQVPGRFKKYDIRTTQGLLSIRSLNLLRHLVK